MGWFKDITKKIKKTVKNVGKTIKHIDPIDFFTDPVNTVTKAFPGLGNSLDTMDPMNTMHQGYGVREAERQYDYEKEIAEQNFERQDYWAQKNFDLQMDAFQYQKDLNEKQLLNEKEAVQRRVADLKAAGLSPTLAAGSAASATPVHAGTVPQGVAPQKMTASDVKARAAMFADSQRKDYMQLALSMLGNFADISRTRAETEFIKAQKDKLVQETPFDLALKFQAAQFAEKSNPYKLRILALEESEKEKDIAIKDYNLILSMDEHAQNAFEILGLELDNQLKQADISLKDREYILKGLAISMSEMQNKNYDSAMKFFDKTYSGAPVGFALPAWSTAASNSVHNIAAHAADFVIDKAGKGKDFVSNMIKKGKSKAGSFYNRVKEIVGADYSK